MKALRLVQVSIMCLSLFACANSPRSFEATHQSSGKSLPTFNGGLFNPVSVINRSEITHLSDQQKQDFYKFLDDPKFVNVARHARVATYMRSILDQFVYSDQTLTAQQSLAAKSGNCLSLTILTTAFAELAGVDLSYQLLDQNPVYSIDNSLLITSNHLRAVLKSEPVKNDAGEYISSSWIRIDYFQTDGLSYVDNISTDFQISLFYSNVAINKLSEHNVDAAYAYARKALQVHQFNPSALNVLGIVHRKNGDLAKAEEIYEHGAKFFANASTFVNNYTALLESQSRSADVNKLLDEVRLNEKDHPWTWVRAGKEAYNKGDFEDAVNYYQRALELAPDVPQVHAFAGTASYAAGYELQSREYIDQALALSNDPHSRKIYKGKLRAFER